MATLYWFPTVAHPDGSSRQPWFRVEGVWGYRASAHPEGASDAPCFRLIGRFCYPTFSMPNAQGASFEVVGSFVYVAGTTRGPWFLIAEASTEGPPFPDRRD